MAPSMCALVARGLGVALVNPLYVGGFAEVITCRPFAPTVESVVHILLPKHRPQSLVAQTFIDSAHSFVAGMPQAP
jgi:DNA-binding transcriptional LysR family regulator